MLFQVLGLVFFVFDMEPGGITVEGADPSGASTSCVEKRSGS